MEQLYSNLALKYADHCKRRSNKTNNRWQVLNKTFFSNKARVKHDFGTINFLLFFLIIQNVCCNSSGIFDFNDLRVEK